MDAPFGPARDALFKGKRRTELDKPVSWGGANFIHPKPPPLLEIINLGVGGEGGERRGERKQILPRGRFKIYTPPPP